MSYVDKNLMAGEKVIYRGTLSKIVFLAPSVVAFILLPGAIAELFKGEVSVLLVIVAIAFFFAFNLLNYLSSEFSVTNKRIVFKSSFFDPKTTELLFEKIQPVDEDWAKKFMYPLMTISPISGNLL